MAGGEKVNSLSREPQDVVALGNKGADIGSVRNDIIGHGKVDQSGSSQSSTSSTNQNGVNNKQNVLRAGDVIEVITKSGAVASTPKFTTFMRNLAKAKLKSIRDAEEYSEKAVEGKASMMEVMAATNEAELVLQQVVTLRDKFVAAYMEVMRMPL